VLSVRTKTGLKYLLIHLDCFVAALLAMTMLLIKDTANRSRNSIYYYVIASPTKEDEAILTIKTI
jgi:hypothetical protein